MATTGDLLTELEAVQYHRAVAALETAVRAKCTAWIPEADASLVLRELAASERVRREERWRRDALDAIAETRERFRLEAEGAATGEQSR